MAAPRINERDRKKVDPPGGTTGRVGCGTGWMRRPCRTQDPRLLQPISVAAANAADIVAVGVELANPAAAAIAVVVVAVIAGSDRAADHGGADETRSDAPAEAETMGFRGRGGGSDDAGDGKCCECKCCNFRFDRHEKLYPVEGGHCGPHAQLDGASSIPVRITVQEFRKSIIC